MKEKQNKLIVLSGPPGVGKSTLAQRYIDEHPMTLNVDIDKVWFMMGQWQQQRPESDKQKMQLSYALVSAHLEKGYDVIVSQHVSSKTHYEQFEQIVTTCGSRLIEATLICPIEDAVRRCIDRGKKSGYKTGFRPGGVLESEGGAFKLRKMYREMMDAVAVRPAMQFIESEYGNEDAAYDRLLDVCR